MNAILDFLECNSNYSFICPEIMSGIGSTHNQELKDKALMEELQTLDSGSQNKPALTSDEKTMALLSHVLTFVGGFIAPLIFYLIEKDKNPKRPFVIEHAKESLNFQISYFIYIMVCMFLTLIFIGALLIIPLFIFGFVVTIIATIKASNGEHFKYPMAIRFIS